MNELKYYLLLALALCFSATDANASNKPNIILFLADDLGWSDTSNTLTNNNNPSDFYETPSLEEIAADGMSFTHAYTNGPNCAPTRSAFLTGQYAQRPTNNIFLVDNLNRGGNDTLLQGPPQGLASGQDALPNNAITIAELLKTAGYTTAYAGKFHVTQTSSAVIHMHGFDFNYGGNSNGGPRNYHANNGRFSGAIGSELDPFAANYTQDYVDQNIKPYARGVQIADMDALVGTSKHVTDALTDAAIHFLDTQADAPVFLMLSHYAVHTPIGDRQARRDLLRKYKSKPLGPNRIDTNASFGALIEGMDQSLARITQYLQTTPDPRNPSQMLSDNTLLVFFSDNGGRLNQSNNGPLRGQKGELTEGGIRVPLVAWSTNSNLVLNNIVNHTPVSGIDLHKTFINMAGVVPPQNYPLDGDGISGLLLNEPSALQWFAQRPIFWHLPGYLVDSQRNQKPQSIIRLGDYKLIYNYEDRRYELYNLLNDISESNNLVNTFMNPTLFEHAYVMADLLRNWLTETNAPYPMIRATGETVTPPPPFRATSRFVLGEASLDGLSQSTLVNTDVSITLQAHGSNAVLSTNANGIGIDSDLDTGNSARQKRIDGSLSTPEELHISFDQPVLLSSIVVGAIDTTGRESLVIRWISGPNPLSNFTPYDGDGYTSSNNTLTFTATSTEATPLRVYLEEPGQRKGLEVEAGTVLGISSLPATGGGILINEIVYQKPD